MDEPQPGDELISAGFMLGQLFARAAFSQSPEIVGDDRDGHLIAIDWLDRIAAGEETPVDSGAELRAMMEGEAATDGEIADAESDRVIVQRDFRLAAERIARVMRD